MWIWLLSKVRLGMGPVVVVLAACSSGSDQDDGGPAASSAGGSTSGFGGSSGGPASQVEPVDWSWTIEDASDYQALDRSDEAAEFGFRTVQIYIRAAGDSDSYPSPFDSQPCLFANSRYGLHSRFLDEAFPEQAGAIIQAGFSQPNTLWFGFVACDAESCQVLLELALLSGGVSIEPPTDDKLEVLRDRLGRCAPYVAERLDQITFVEAPPP